MGKRVSTRAGKGLEVTWPWGAGRVGSEAHVAQVLGTRLEGFNIQRTNKQESVDKESREIPVWQELKTGRHRTTFHPQILPLRYKFKGSEGSSHTL